MSGWRKFHKLTVILSFILLLEAYPFFFFFKNCIGVDCQESPYSSLSCDCVALPGSQVCWPLHFMISTNPGFGLTFVVHLLIKFLWFFFNVCIKCPHMQQLGLSQVEARNQNSSQLPTWWQGPSHLSHHHLLPSRGHIIRKLSCPQTWALWWGYKHPTCYIPTQLHNHFLKLLFVIFPCLRSPISELVGPYVLVLSLHPTLVSNQMAQTRWFEQQDFVFSWF